MTLIPSTEWAKQKGMNSFLAVTYGSTQPAKFLEMCVRLLSVFIDEILT